MPQTHAAPGIAGQATESIAAVLLERAGIVLAPERRAELAVWLVSHLAELGLESADQYLALLTTGPRQDAEFQTLLGRASPSDAAFFGHAQQLRSLERDLLPRLIEARQDTRRLRLCIAACGRGQDAYTLAMIVHRRLGLRLLDWCVEIYGCDLNRASIDHASRGVYDPHCMERVPEIMRLRYFTQHGEQWAANEELTQMVSFEAIDLRDRAGIARHGSWDAIVCRDMLGDLEPAARSDVLALFHQQLADDGVLLVGESELLPLEPGPFTPLPDRSTAGYRKA